MKHYINALRKTELFSSVTEAEIKRLMKCVNATPVTCIGGNKICMSENKTGILISGVIDVSVSDDVIYTLEAGSVFSSSPLPASVLLYAVSDCTIVMLDTHRLAAVCKRMCPFHQTVVSNFLTISRRQLIRLFERFVYVSRHTLREKLLFFLGNLYYKNNGNAFELPITKKQLAEYICADRSSVITALNKLCDEGVVTVDNNYFKLTDK